MTERLDLGRAVRGWSAAFQHQVGQGKVKLLVVQIRLLFAQLTPVEVDKPLLKAWNAGEVDGRGTGFVQVLDDLSRLNQDTELAGDAPVFVGHVEGVLQWHVEE